MEEAQSPRRKEFRGSDARIQTMDGLSIQWYQTPPNALVKNDIRKIVAQIYRQV
jgi:hypothetical protein